MKRRYYLIVLVVILSFGIIIGLQVNGYLFNDQRIIPPGSLKEWEDIKNRSSNGQTSGSGSPAMLNLTDKMKEIPGIEKIKYDVFLSNKSMQQVIEYYTDILANDGYSYHSEYSGMMTYGSSDLSYHSFAKGLNGVVIFLSEFGSKTWVCYTTGGVLQYQQIYKYMATHHLLQ